jgi:hypothetical protein
MSARETFHIEIALPEPGHFEVRSVVANEHEARSLCDVESLERSAPVRLFKHPRIGSTAPMYVAGAEEPSSSTTTDADPGSEER